MPATIDELREMSREIDRLFSSGEEDQGKAILNRAGAAAPATDQAYAYFFAGERASYLESDHLKQERLFAKAIALRPEDSFLLRNMGACLSFQKREEEAITWFDKALAANPKDNSAMRSRGASLSCMRHYEEAISWYDKALAADPSDHAAMRNRGTCLSNMGRIEESVIWLERALALNPKDPSAMRTMGVSLSNLGRREEAIYWFAKALALNPRDGHALCSRGMTLSNMGRHNEAIIWIDKALALNPRNEDAIRCRGKALSRADRLEEALIWFDKALAFNPKDEGPFYWKAFVLHCMGRDREAIPYAKKAVELSPSSSANISLYNLLASTLGRPSRKSREPSLPASDATGTNRDKTDVTVQQDLLASIVRHVQSRMAKAKDRLLKQMSRTEERRRTFLEPASHIDETETLFLVLRKWNSYTPIIPDSSGDRHVGGGYVVFNRGQATIIDPGHNFIENFFQAGFNIHDIHNIVITHAHNDHTADLESLLTLTHEYNEGKSDDKVKRLNLYLNTGTLVKFSGFLDLRADKYIGRVHTLMPDHDYALGKGVLLRALPAYHDEIVTRDYAVGLSLTFTGEQGQRRIVITSDTCLMPRLPTGDKGLDMDGPEIWMTYPKDPPIDLLVAHLGSIQKQEFTKLDAGTVGGGPGSTALAPLLYKNHLGIIGTVRVITSLQPRLAVISEFGEELASVQEDLISLTRKIVEDFCAQSAREPVEVVPGDLPFVYRVWDRSVYCVLARRFVPASEITFAVPDDKARTFYYYDKRFSSDAHLMAKAKKFAEDFERVRWARKPGKLYFTKKP